MKPSSLRLKETLLNKEFGVHDVRVMKASSNGNSLNGSRLRTEDGTACAQHKPEVRLVGSSPDYCDLEIMCGCGERNQVRCWNMASVEEKKAAA